MVHNLNHHAYTYLINFSPEPTAKNCGTKVLYNYRGVACFVPSGSDSSDSTGVRVNMIVLYIDKSVSLLKYVCSCSSI